jgi:flagellar M-ring protein FliF
MKPFLQSLLHLWSQLGLNQRVSIIVAALAVVIGLTSLVVWSRRPDWQLLYGRMGEKDASAVISFLQQQNVPHRVEQGGAAVLVPSSQVHRLRMELAGRGVPSGEGVGFEIFDRGNFGVSDFVQRTNYARALQGELARTIAQLEGVRSARVLIVQPENRLLLVDQSVRPSASVFVDLVGSRLHLEAVNSIRHLVSNSVQGLQPDQVAVVDNRGRVLSEELRDDPLLANASSQIRYRQSIEEYFARKVETMLAAAVGAGNAVVRVSAEVDTEAATIEQERFDPESQVVRSQTQTEDSTSAAESRPGTPVGTPANLGGLDDAAPGFVGGASTRNEQTRKNRTTSYEIDSTRTRIVRNPGTIRRLTAAVFINQRLGGELENPTPLPRSPEELNALRQLVLNALGVSLAPGQTLESVVALQEVPFATEPFARHVEQLRDQTVWQPWIDGGLKAAPVVLAVVVLLWFWRRLGREKPEPVPLELLETLPTFDPLGHDRRPHVTPEIINDLIRQKPANVGAALRDWVAVSKPN